MHLWRDHKDGGGGDGQGAHDAGPGLGLGSAGTATEPGSGTGGHGHGHGEGNITTSPGSQTQQQHDDGGSNKQGSIRRNFRKVVPGLPRTQTFKRQQSEQRDHLQPVQPTPAERRAASVDRRMHATNSASTSLVGLGVGAAALLPRSSAPNFHHHHHHFGRSSHISQAESSVPSLPAIPRDHATVNSSIRGLNGHELEQELDKNYHDHHGLLRAPAFAHVHGSDAAVSDCDAHSITSSQYHNMIHDELEKIWILNLSMHFRDKSKREKFFVTYRQKESLWRRVTVSLDYRDAQEGSLEEELVDIKFQRDKSSRIYEAIRDSLGDIQFYPTVTNLKLQTTDGRLHVHVVEDVNEIISYPTVRMIQHMGCRRIKESKVEFDSHLSGFVYKVRVNGETLIKKEIPGPDTVDEFLYEINALNRLRAAENVIEFYGIIVDDSDEHVKGLLISFAEHGALIDIIYDYQLQGGLPWSTRERWARQIVGGLADIHEAGFVQGDFTLSNIVINTEWNAKIIDINRRGCPVGWEPPEATPLIESSQRISMYIGVKSDLYQLGMVLWALATQEDEPEAHGRPLRIGPEVTDVPDWYVEIVKICLDPNPRKRRQALDLLDMFPEPEPVEQSLYSYHNPESVSGDDGYSRQEYLVGTEPTNGVPKIIKTVESPSDRGWDYFSSNAAGASGIGRGRQDAISPAPSEDQHWYPPRGRSPPSPLPSDDGYDDPARSQHHLRPWGNSSTYQEPSNLTVPSSYGDRQASSYTESDVGDIGKQNEADSSRKSAQQHDPRISSTSFISTAPSGETDAASTSLKDSLLREALKWRPETAPSSAPTGAGGASNNKSRELTLREQYGSEGPSSSNNNNNGGTEPQFNTTQSHHNQARFNRNQQQQQHYGDESDTEEGRREKPLSRADSGKYFTEPTNLKPGPGPDLAYAAINEARDRDRLEQQFRMEAAEAMMAGRYHGHGHSGLDHHHNNDDDNNNNNTQERTSGYAANRGGGNSNGNTQLERDREREYQRYGSGRELDVLKGIGGGASGGYDLPRRDSGGKGKRFEGGEEGDEDEIDMDLFAGQKERGYQQHHDGPASS
ncbi:hypothetical protein QBC45DRAFT_466187 [Copromyces sp. CBS 386.78]|nr:hypothetical protein QBC45DRAFT_466187 [Copromyces sp. CBS 386.78]